MPPGPAALVKPVPCCVPRLQPCCPAKEVISQQRQVTLSFFLFFFSFIFFSSFPFPPSPPSSVFSAPRTPGSSEQAANLSAQHNTSPPGGKEKQKKEKGKPNPPNCSQTGSLRALVPLGASSPPGSPVGSASASRHGTKWPKLAARRSEHSVEPCLSLQGGFWCPVSYLELLFFVLFLPLASRVQSTCKAIKKIS